MAWRVVFLEIHFELGCEDLSDLGVQHRNGAGFGARQFFLQRDGFFQLPDFLQNFDDHGDLPRVAEQLHKALLNAGAAEEMVEFIEQGLPAA